MKLAIPLYGGRVCPRFGYTQEILIVELEGGQVVGRDRLKVDRYFPDQIPEVLGQKGVELVISGGINRYLQNLFRSRGIEVIWGIIGEADEVLSAFISGRLSAGMGCCGRRRRRRRFRGRGYLP